MKESRSLDLVLQPHAGQVVQALQGERLAPRDTAPAGHKYEHAAGGLRSLLSMRARMGRNIAQSMTRHPAAPAGRPFYSDWRGGFQGQTGCFAWQERS